MAWKVVLEGHQFDLERLEAELSGPHSVGRDSEGEFVLSSTEFEGIDDALRVKPLAEGIVRQINGAYRMASASFEGVRATGNLKDGSNRHAIIAGSTAHVRTRVNDVHISVDGGVVRSPPSAASQRVAAAAQDEVVREVLDVLGGGEADWSRLYKAFEIVRDDAGGQGAVDALTNKSDRSAFTVSANNPNVSGEGARHARLEGTPRKTMNLREARDYIGRLVDAWIASKS